MCSDEAQTLQILMNIPPTPALAQPIAQDRPHCHDQDIKLGIPYLVIKPGVAIGAQAIKSSHPSYEVLPIGVAGMAFDQIAFSGAVFEDVTSKLR